MYHLSMLENSVGGRVLVDPHGVVYFRDVDSKGQQALRKLDAAGQPGWSVPGPALAKMPTEYVGFNIDNAITTDDQGNTYVDENEIVALDSSGRRIAQCPVSEMKSQKWWDVEQIAVGPLGEVYAGGTTDNNYFVSKLPPVAQWTRVSSRK